MGRKRNPGTPDAAPDAYRLDKDVYKRQIEMQAGDSKGHLAGDRHIYENIGGEQAQILVVESTPGGDHESLRHF